MAKTKKEELLAAQDMQTLLHKCENAEKEIREALALARAYKKRTIINATVEVQQQLQDLMRDAEKSAEFHRKKAAKL